MATTAIRAGISSSPIEDVIAFSGVSADRRLIRFRDGVPILSDVSLAAFRIDVTPAKTWGAAVGVPNSLQSIRMADIIHPGSSLESPLSRLLFDMADCVLLGVYLLGVAFAGVTRGFLGVMGGSGTCSACFIGASAMVR